MPKESRDSRSYGKIGGGSLKIKGLNLKKHNKKKKKDSK